MAQLLRTEKTSWGGNKYIYACDKCGAEIYRYHHRPSQSKMCGKWASEVRKLAEQSANTTNEIDQVIHKITEGLHNILASTQKGNELVNKQNQSMDETIHAFETIQEKVDIINQLLRDLNTGMLISKGQSHEVLASVENISAVIEENATGIQDIAHSTSEQTKVSGEVMNKVALLAQTVELLEQELSVFKIEE